jgi:hypothetical protein
LAKIFENTLLSTVVYMFMIATVGYGALGIASLSVEDVESLAITYAGASVLFGALSIAFGVALIRLQDGMGEMSRVAGLLEIALGCVLVTVVLFFIAYVFMIPAVALEILVLYRGYEYLSRSDAAPVAPA